MRSCLVVPWLMTALLLCCIGAQETTEYEYDIAGRLSIVTKSAGGSNTVYYYRHDAVGNVRVEARYGPADADADYDEDGMRDLDELHYMADLDSDAAGDDDGDGLNNSNELAFGSSPVLKNTDDDAHDDYEEWVADTDPDNPNSFFRVIAVSNLPPVTIYFESSSNRLYTLRVANDMVEDVWSNVPGAGPRTGLGGTDLMTDTNAPPTGVFYRLKVEKP